MSAGNAGNTEDTGTVGTVVSLGQVIVDLTMRVPRVPNAGEDVFADATDTCVGASFNTLHAVRRMGVPAAHGGIVGTGAWGNLVAAALADDGIDHIGATDPAHDTGFCVALTDGDGERTFVSMRGAEAMGDAHAFDGVRPAAGDVVHLSGYTLVHRTADALAAFLERTRERDFKAVFDPSPVIAQVDGGHFARLLAYRPIWSCNEREAGLLAARLGLKAADGGPADDAPIDAIFVARLAAALGAPLIVRMGAAGAWVVPEPDATPVPVAGFPVRPVDTNGAGDCHAGVLCAELARGAMLVDATSLANAAASIAVTRRGPATCPTRFEAQQLCGTVQPMKGVEQ